MEMIVYKIANRQDGFSFKYTILNGVQVVGGSNPLAPTSKIKDLQLFVVSPFSFIICLGAFLGAKGVLFD